MENKQTYIVKKKSDMIDIGWAYFFKNGIMPTKKSIIEGDYSFYSFKDDINAYFTNNSNYHKHLKRYYKEIDALKVNICHECGEIFYPSNTNEDFPEFCSNECLNKSNLYNKCKICGRVFNAQNGYQDVC